MAFSAFVPVATEAFFYPVQSAQQAFAKLVKGKLFIRLIDAEFVQVGQNIIFKGVLNTLIERGR